MPILACGAGVELSILGEGLVGNTISVAVPPRAPMYGSVRSSLSAASRVYTRGELSAVDSAKSKMSAFSTESIP